MRLYLNTDTGVLSTAPGGSQPIRRVDGKRGDVLEIEVVPSAALASGATGIFVAKPKGSYTVAAVVLDGAWEAPQEAGAGYLFAVNLNTEELDALFTAELADVVLMAEITWTAAGKVRSTQTFDLVVARDVWRGDEEAPSPVEAAPSFRLTSPDGSVWEISIGNDGQLIRTKIS